MSGLERFAYAVPRIEDLAPPVAAALQAHLRSGEAVRQIIFSRLGKAASPNGVGWLNGWAPGLLNGGPPVGCWR